MGRLPNNFGQIVKLTGKREKPFQARKCIKKYYDPDAEVYKRDFVYLGTFKTKKEALQALAKFNECPEAVSQDKTIEDVYNEWWVKKAPELVNTDAYTNAWRYIAPLYKMPVNAVKLSHIEALSDTLPKGKRTISKMVKIVLSQIFEYSIQHEYCTNNPAKYMRIASQKAKIKRIPFSLDEIHTLENSGQICAQIAFIGIYTGLRPSELCELDASMFNWDDFTITTGSKSDAGRDRVIPIHPAIRDRLKALCKKGKLWNINYTKYRRDIIEMFPNHLPHDSRHTFITKAKEMEFNEYILKLIVGHSIKDITESVYTHRTAEQLHNEMSKLNY